MNKKLLSWLVICLCFLFESSCAAKSCDPSEARKFFSFDVEFSSPLTVEEAEKRTMVNMNKDGKSTMVPFGAFNNEWNELKANYEKNGGCLIYFITEKRSWASFSGRAGYLLIKDGKVIGSIVTEMN
ncbi:hypothetical protein FE236_08360 [Mariprofundus erugo]|uniref:hypothetical protein n=1 Tax=Mariprofundus erugo TaxID=2528639 RepID=UPI0010FDE691|nr:hypothetical protein [Mariprofundus erugo]TLS75751.1 hypothetical protein FE236_08360 [Mariprofundus erugo]